MLWTSVLDIFVERVEIHLAAIHERGHLRNRTHQLGADFVHESSAQVLPCETPVARCVSGSSHSVVPACRSFPTSARSTARMRFARTGHAFLRACTAAGGQGRKRNG